MTAEEAARALAVSRATLYAYVSRGLIRSESVPGTRRRRYRAEDVRALQRGKEMRSDPVGAARRTLHFGGLPVLESGLTLIEEGRLYYRGRDAVALARDTTLEEVAELLWGAPVPRVKPPRLDRHTQSLPLADAFQAFAALAAAADSAAHDLRPEAVRRAGARILHGFAALAAGTTPEARPVASTLQTGWQVQNAEPLQAALVLTADHELNVSAFTARCVASAGASPYAAVGAAVGALTGFKHGGHTERVAAFFDEVAQARSAHDAIARRLRLGEPIPGFGHRLYEDGDPRARPLIALAPSAEATPIQHAARDLLGEEPNLDFGLVALCRALGLPREAPFALFALGRTVGWIAHALEQYATDRMIRPRARYTGPAPEA